MKKKELILYISLFLSGVLLSSLVFVFVSFFHKESPTDIVSIEDNINNEASQEDLLGNSSSIVLEGGAKEEICKESYRSIDELDDEIYQKFIRGAISFDIGNDIFYTIRTVDDCDGLMKNDFIDNDRNVDCKLKYAMKELFSGKALDKDLQAFLSSHVKPFSKGLQYIESQDCPSLEQFDEKLPGFCSDKNTFIQFQKKVFQESLDIICKS